MFSLSYSRGQRDVVSRVSQKITMDRWTEKTNSFLPCWTVLLLHDGKFSDTIDVFEMCYGFLQLIISSLSVE